MLNIAAEGLVAVWFWVCDFWVRSNKPKASSGFVFVVIVVVVVVMVVVGDGGEGVKLTEPVLNKFCIVLKSCMFKF